LAAAGLPFKSLQCQYLRNRADLAVENVSSQIKGATATSAQGAKDMSKRRLAMLGLVAPG